MNFYFFYTSQNNLTRVTEKADPGIPNICPFKKDIIEERNNLIKQKDFLKQKKVEYTKIAQQNMRNATISGKVRYVWDILLYLCPLIFDIS